MNIFFRTRGTVTPKLRVIGVPRSGTNLAKYLIESHTKVRCYFNYGWWKHAPIPPLIQANEPLLKNEPTIIMFREPVRQIAAFFKLSRGGSAAITGANDIESFVASPIIMKPWEMDMRYHFATPIEYWIQFYYSALEWPNCNKVFIELSELQARPDIIRSALASAFPESRFEFEAVLPDDYIGRNGDAHVSEVWKFETGKDAKKEIAETENLVTVLPESQIDLIRNGRAAELYERLRSQRVS